MVMMREFVHAEYLGGLCKGLIEVLTMMGESDRS